ncbi:MAG: hypothetical protein HYX79_01165 [Chloroflexi bacterium]|nr:hypothetical protein [Chloroflexota bacterium]
MIVQCPHCGGTVVVGRFGRRPLNIPVTKVCDALQLHRSITAAAESLKCSRAYIYKTLKASGLKPENVFKGHMECNMRGK